MDDPLFLGDGDRFLYPEAKLGEPLPRVGGDLFRYLGP